MSQRSQSKAEAHEELYVELMESAEKTADFIIETDEGKPDIEFDVKPADKPTRNKLRSALPSGLLDGVDLPENKEDLENLSVDDIDLSGLDLQSMTFDEEATKLWLDEIAEHFTHEYYSKSEVRNIFDTLPDDVMISAGTVIMEMGSSMGPVTGFRRED